MTYVALTCQSLIAAVYGFAALSKLSPARFADFIRSTGALLPARWSRRRTQVGVLVLTCELAVVALSVALTAAGLILGLALSAAFAVALTRAVIRGERTTCRCFGASSTPIGPAHIVRNVLLAGVSVTGLIALQWSTSVNVAGAAVSIAAGIIFAFIIAMLDELLALFKDPVVVRALPVKR